MSPKLNMKILFVISSTNPSSGGPVEGIKTITPVLQRMGHHIEIVCLDAPNEAWICDFPFIIHALGPSFLKYQYSIKFVPWLRRHAQEFDCIIINGIWQYASFGTWLALHKSETPYFVYTHGMLDPWFKREYPLKHFKKILYWFWADYRVLRDARAVLFTCQEEQQLARQSFTKYDCSEAVVEFGTAEPPHNTHEERQIFFDRFPQLKNKRIILFLGRIHPKKGCDILIKSFAAITSADKDLCLVFAGPDQVGWQEQLCKIVVEMNISPQVFWTGMLEGHFKWGALYAAEVFVLPSHQENFGIAVVEAMACSLPVIISKRVNIWREIAKDQAGIIANDDQVAVTDALYQWIQTSPVEKQLMGQNARQCFLKRFNIEKSANSLLKTLNKYGVRS